MHKCEKAVKKFLRELICRLRPGVNNAVAAELDFDYESGTVHVHVLDTGKSFVLSVPKECMTLLVNYLRLAPVIPKETVVCREGRKKRSGCRSGARRREPSEYFEAECG